MRGNDEVIVLSMLVLVFRFNMIFHRCFGGRLCRGNEHLWHHVNEEVADFYTATFQRETGMAIDVLCTGYHPHVLMYALDELFFMYKRIQANNLDVLHVVAYEILEIASLHCTKQHSSKKKCHTLGDAYPKVNLRDINGLKCLAWAIYDGVYMPSDEPALSGYNKWESIVVGTLIHLVFCGQTNKEHCKSMTIASFNMKQATGLAQQQGVS